MFTYTLCTLLFRAYQNCDRARMYAVSVRYNSVCGGIELALQILEAAIHIQSHFVVFLLFSVTNI